MPRVRILVAEDDREMRRLLGAVLRNEGYSVAMVSNGNELLSLLGAQFAKEHLTSDIIISDICMPGRTGLDVLDGLRRSGWRTSIILLTAFGDEETHARARRLGAFAVLDKPFEMDALVELVRNLALRPNDDWLESMDFESDVTIER